MKYRIGLDLDGVVYHFERTMRYMLRRRIIERGDAVPIELRAESQTWDWVKQFVAPEDWYWLWEEAGAEGLFRYGHVVGGAIEGAQALSELGDVVIVTSRPKIAVHDTLAWLTFMFDKVPLAGVYILGHESKSSIRPLPDVFIEDAPHNIEDMRENTPEAVKIVIFDCAWNKDVKNDHKVRRAYGWPATVRAVAEAKEGKW